MARSIDALTAKSWLSDGNEIAFLDVREHGQYGEGHPFLATSVPYSRFEPTVVALVPNAHVRLVLIDAGDGTAQQAAHRAEGLGYSNVNVLTGGTEGWQRAGLTLFAGVNVPSKTFGELVEMKRHTPRITALELKTMIDAKERLVIVDGRPFSEFERMSIPGGICCPNGELALRIGDIVSDPDTTIVVNCAGRTRSIIGAQTLIDAGVPNRVVALENGTQGWFLAGLELERGARRRHAMTMPSQERLKQLTRRAQALAAARGVGFVSISTVAEWRAQTRRTTYVIDVRTPEEIAIASAPAAVHAPGGQLIQATDQWVGVKGSRIVLFDDDGVRASMVAQWLSQLGHETYVLEGGLDAARRLAPAANAPRFDIPPWPRISPAELSALSSRAHMLDVRSSMAYRAGHTCGAVWTCRPRLAASLPSDRSKTLAIIGDGSPTAALVAADAIDLGCPDIRLLDGNPDTWTAAGLAQQSTPDEPPDAECIDYLFFVHDRHDGNAAAARRYLEWEMGLLDQLDETEKALFKVADQLS